MAKKLLHLLLTLTLALPAISQTDTLYRFLDGDYTDSRNARFAVFKTVSLFKKVAPDQWQMSDYDLNTGKILARGWYQDSLRKVAIGTRELFYVGGAKHTHGYYKDGMAYGVWRHWYDNGTLMDSTVHGDGGRPIGIGLRWFSDGKVKDSIYFDSESPGHGRAIEWFDNGIVYGQGPILDGKRSGAWKFYRPDGTLTTEETLVADSAVAVRCFNPDGSVQTKDCFAEREAEFPGGKAKWLAYISRKLEAHADYIISKGGTGLCVIQFVIDKDGKVTDAKVKDPSGTYLDQEALELIQASPKWIPAIQHNRPVKAYRRQPIDFTAQ